MPNTVNIPLLRASILFRPHHLKSGNNSTLISDGGAAGYRPRVRNVYSVQTCSVIAGKPATLLYMRRARKFNMFRGKPRISENYPTSKVSSSERL